LREMVQLAPSIQDTEGMSPWYSIQVPTLPDCNEQQVQIPKIALKKMKDLCKRCVAIPCPQTSIFNQNPLSQD
jgi:hypothetical protein